MRRKPSPTADHEADLARFAWWISFFVTLTLVVTLGLAHSAQAQTAPAAILPATAAALPADDEDFEGEAESSEDEGFEGYECDEEIEECEEDESGDGPGGGPEAPAECVLTSVKAAVFAAGNRDRVRLQIHYKTTAPTAVIVDYGLHGSKGALFLGSERKRFGKKGVLRLSRNLTEPQMAKVLAAKGFTVRLRVPEAPRYCASLFERQVDVRQATPSGLAWQQSE
jgi:hypothetical protein